MTLFKVYMHALPILCGLGLAYTLWSHLHITDTHFTDNVQQGRVFIHTCSPECVQHAYNEIRLHNTIIMVNTPHYSHTLNLHSAPTGTPNFQNYVSHGLHFKSTKAASFLWCFGHFSSYSLNQFCLERFHLLHQCMCHQPVFKPIQQNGHYTSIQYWPRRERIKVTLKSTYATTVKKKACLAFLMFSSTDPLPSIPQTFSNIPSWQNWTIHYTLWNIHTAQFWKGSWGPAKGTCSQ